ncbi:MAG: NAD(P)H-hydrate dehydratase [Candidatus Geothermincolales bacterium]
MRAVYPDEMKALDGAAIEGGIPSLQLMERAGRGVAEHARDMLGPAPGKKVIVVAGKGNNGGDGFVAARYLKDRGYQVEVFLLGSPVDLSEDCLENYRRFLEVGGEVKRADIAPPPERFSGADLVIDAIFGTGFQGMPMGVHADIIRSINSSGVPVLSVDVPSGVDAATGEVVGEAIRAERTVTFAWPKVGLYLYPAAELVGELVVIDIGIPHHLLDEVVRSDFTVLEDDEVAPMLPRRSPHAHKMECGRVLVVGGSTGLTGAAALCSRAAMRCGAGVVTLGVPARLHDIMEMKLTEVMTVPLPDLGAGFLAEEAAEEVLALQDRFDVLALGPGLGREGETARAVWKLLSHWEKPLVLDADGLNAAAINPSPLEDRTFPTVITPHPGELGRLLGKSPDEVQRDRLGSAQEACRRFGCVTVLKGANTLVASPQGKVYINPLALAGLATAGSGDVLTGAIAAILAQGADPLQAAACGVYLHGKAASIASSVVGPVGFLAGDLVSHLPLALGGLLGRESRR